MKEIYFSARDPYPRLHRWRKLLTVFMILFTVVSYSQTWVIGSGTGTNTTTNFPAPLGNYYEGSKQQYIYRASELTAAGVTPGQIESFGFNVINLGSAGVQEGFTIYMKNSSTNSLASAWETGMTQVTTTQDYQAIQGWNMFELDLSSFVWDGVSNIIVQVCYESTPEYDTNAQVQWTTGLPAGTSRTYRADGASNLCNYSGSASSNTNPTYRPNAAFYRTPPSCNGSPDGGTATLTPSSGNPGSTFLASATGATEGLGITYQWQKSANGVNGWQDITAATTKSSNITAETAPIGTVTHYRLKVTCTNSGEIEYSNVVTHTLALTYCQPTYSSGCSGGAKISNFATTGAIVDVSNNTGTSSCGAGGYNNFTATHQIQAIAESQINFTVGVGSYSAAVKIWADWNQDGDFEDTDELLAASASTISSGGNFTGSFTVPAGVSLGDTRLRVRVVESTTAFTSCSSQSWGEAEDYTITIITPPSCLPPTGSIGTINVNSASFNWTAIDNADGYDWMVVADGADPETATPVSSGNTTGLTANATGLTSGTAYDFYVKTDCGTEGESIWSKVDFSTPLVATIPWNEGFATTTVPGWLTSGYSLLLSTNAIGSPSSPKYNDTDTYLIYRNPYSSSTTGNFTTISVGAVASSHVLTFDYKLVNYSDNNPPAAGSGNFKVEISTDFGATYTLLETVPNDGIAGWKTKSYDLSAYAGQYVKVKITDTWTSGDYFIGFDNFFIGVPPTCSPPTGAALVIADGFSAEFTWNAAGGENIEEYNWVVVADGADPGVATPVASGNTTDTSVIATGLSPVTAYDFYVRTDCGSEDGESFWAKVDFTTTVACPAPTGGSVSDRTATSATLSWMSTGDGFEINWGTGTFAAGAGPNTETGITETSYTFPDNLNPTTTYRWFVRQDCGVDGMSTWAGPYTFTTLLANDNIEDALPVVCGGTYTGSTATATNDQPNPAIFGVASTLSPNVWYSYTGNGDPEAVTLSLCNSGFDTAILVATGEPGNLTWIAGNEDYCGTSGFRSQVEFNSDGTTTYWIMVRGYGVTSTGTYELVVSCAEPCLEPNDEIANAEPIEIGIPFDSENTCATASPQAYPSCGSPFSSYSDVWYSFNSGANDVVKISLTPQTDVAVGYAVYSGTPGDLTQVGCNTTGVESTLNLNLFENYFVRVYSTVGDSRGEFTINLNSEHSYIVWTPEDEWSNLTGPTSTDDAVIVGDLNIGTDVTDLVVNNLVVYSTGNINISANQTLTVNGLITNNSSNGANGFIVSNDANLIQISNAANAGEITVIRESNPMIRLDYTLWSSPVAGQNLFGFSPETVNGVTNYLGSEGRIYVYDGSNGYVNPTPFTETSVMNNGTGYLFRAPNNWSATTAEPYIGTFTGVPNNGNINATTHVGNFTSIGNPYPSNITVNALYAANTGINTLYLWNNNYSSGNNYATCTNGVGCAAATGGGNTPNGVITVGQGFIVHTDDASVAFNNSMRVNSNGIFFKVDELESHRFWLNLNGEEEEKFNQILIGYVSEATNGVDNQIDGKMFNYEGSALYSLVDEEKLVIQGRALPFEATDVVPLGFKAAENGKFTISLADFDGLFAEGSVTVYLKDNELNVTHNLMESDYVFESVQGTFKERFEVVYETDETMGASDFNDNLVQIYQQDNQIVVSSKTEKILSVELFDMQGRNIHSNQKVNANIYQIQSASFGTQVLVVRVQTQNGEILTKKVITK